MYLGWYDDSVKKTPAEKIKEAAAAYTARFQTRPNVVLLNAVDRVEIEDMVVRTESYIRPNNFWIGWEDIRG